MEIPMFGNSFATYAVLCSTAAFLFYVYQKRKHEALKQKIGINGPTPFPLMGTFYQQMKHGQVETDLNNIKKYGKVHLTMMGGRPVVAVADAEMLKHIMVKDFQYFTNRRKFAAFSEPPLDKMLTTVDDDEWKNIRVSATPAFSGGKLRKMTVNINQCAESYTKNLAAYVDKDDGFDVKNLSGCFSSDVLARVAFGVDIDSQNDPQHPFIKNMTDLLDFSFTKKPALLAAVFAPFLAKPLQKLGVTILSKDTCNFFVALIKQAIEARNDGEERHDYLQLMLDSMSSNKDSTNADRKPLTLNEVISNCVIFFFAAYGTIGDSMSFTLYALAKHPEMQERVYEEIKEVLGDEQSVSYDDIKAMTYLDMFVQEALRMYPPATNIDRECSEEVTIDGVTFPKGCVVNIPVGAVHKDPEYWPDPEMFDPERFKPEKKAEMNPIHWLPFGFGPRNCIGLRMALLEIKIAYVHLIRKFKINLMSADQELKRNPLTGSVIDLSLKVTQR